MCNPQCASLKGLSVLVQSHTLCSKRSASQGSCSFSCAEMNTTVQQQKHASLSKGDRSRLGPVGMYLEVRHRPAWRRHRLHHCACQLHDAGRGQGPMSMVLSNGAYTRYSDRIPGTGHHPGSLPKIRVYGIRAVKLPLSLMTYYGGTS
jgi:hypothetical protein